VVPGHTGTLENLARVGSATPDPIIGNNEAKVSGRSTQSANLSVLKTASARTVVAGDLLRYKIAVHNTGPSAAVGVTVTDVLAPGLRLTSMPEHCTADGQRLTCLVGRIDPGTTAAVTLEVTVGRAYAGKSVTNTATADSTTPDQDPADNASSVTVAVTPPTPPTAPPTPKPGGELGDTGSPVGPGLGLVALALVLAGTGLLVATRRRRGQRATRS
jgi:uncharacterized repeat protein (TIGR01451 family)